MAVLRVLAAHRPPLCFIEGGDNGSQPIFSGYLIDLLPTLLNQANLQLVSNLTEFVGSGGKLQANGTWTGVMGELTSNQTDLALFPLTLTSQRSQYIQSTPPYMDDGYGILVKTRRLDSGRDCGYLLLNSMHCCWSWGYS
jgi:ABC-type amino acid transport substrate-binding protein